MTLTVMILKAGLRLPGTGIALTAFEGLKQTPAPCEKPGSASCLTGPAARAPAAGPVAVSPPAAARQSRGHVTPACAGRVFKARVAQIGTIAQAD